ncbi:DNA cytosine methyltransferase [Alphaproteobacteria bacterium]|nr:DNA cytosine methyltransferase [Alphaproteobacteria bacterium]
MIPVVDLFAGPGGLGEGFCSYKNHSIYKIILSVEKEKFACETLLLRSFFHQFKKKPQEYYDYLKGKITRQDLFNAYPNNFHNAKDSIMNLELGVGHNSLKVSNKIKTLINKNSHWVLLGGPPCQAYSVAGRSKIKNIKGKQLFENDNRHKLYKQYLRIISDHAPSVFIMENVKGLISSKIEDKNTLNDILKDLKFPDRVFKNKEKKEYKLFALNKKKDLFQDDFLINCSKHGVPQRRERLFIIGVRKDINLSKITPLKEEDEIPIEKVISNLPKLRSIISKGHDSHDNWLQLFDNFINSEFKPLENILKNNKKINNFGSNYIKFKLSKNQYKSDWFDDPRIGGVLNHQTRKYLSKDIERYIFSSLFAKKYKRSPKITDFPKNLYPKHKNVLQGDNKKIIFNDRFRVQLKNKPATTITSHISKDGHYYIHYDTSQARSLSVREAARIQTFPDNYFFEGNKTQQYIQVGNAVPPLIAKKIASIIYQDIFNKI